MALYFPSLMSPGQINQMKLKNRIVMPPMVRNYATTDGILTRQSIDHYVARARGGAGLIIVEASYVHPSGKLAHQEIGIDDDRCIPGLANFTDAVHEWNCKIAIQLVHGGRQSTTAVTKLPVVAPSAVPCPVTGGVPKELTIAEVAGLVEAFGQAARRAKQSGFDAVELHGAHGYLISQFFSPNTNRRNDKYGGDLKGRATFALEIIKRVRELVGASFPITIRLNGEDGIDGGLTLDDSRALAQILEAAGIDAIHVTGGTYEANANVRRSIGASATNMSPRGHLAGYAAQIKSVVKIPVIAVGSLTPELAEDLLKTGNADFVAIGRGLLADPEWSNKVMLGEPETIRPCIRCTELCRARLPLGIRCTVNAEVGYESYPLQPAFKLKKVMVVGGGPAGMEAARIAAMRGHEVTLYEKSDRLGGHLIEASVPSFKEELRDYLNWIIRQMAENGVRVELNRDVTPALVEKEKPEVIVVATGSSSCSPNIAGIDKPIVTSAVAVLLGKALSGDRPVVAGGGAVGSELALHLAQQGKKVTLVEMLPEIASDVISIKNPLTVQLADAGVKVMTNTRITGITDEGVQAISDGKNLINVSGDRVILAMGMASDNKIYNTFRTMAKQVFLIGDGAEPRRLGEAIHEGYRVGSVI